MQTKKYKINFSVWTAENENILKLTSVALIYLQFNFHTVLLAANVLKHFKTFARLI